MKCSVCGGKEFTLDEGVQVCGNCGTLLEEFLEFQTEEYLKNLDISRLHRIERGRAKKKEEKHTCPSSNYELYNDMLCEWTIALRSLGASPRFEKLLLELWILYLQRLGVAFKPENAEDNSKEGTKTTVDLNGRYPYDISFDREVSGSITKKISQSKPTFQCFEYSKHHVDINDNWLQILLSLTYLAVLLAEESILLMDLVRWCLEGEIPYLSAHNLVAEKDRTKLDVKYTKIIWPSAFEIKQRTENLILYMNLYSLPCPPLKPIVDRVVRLLKLPGCVGSLAMEHMKDIMTIQSSMPVVGIELYVMAAVIIVVKAHLGLNDVDEVYLSRAAKKLNAEIGEKIKVHYFCWEEWEIYMNKLIWFCGEIDPVTRIHCRNLEAISKIDSKVFSQYLWTEGIWRLGSATKSKGIEKQTPLIAEKMLRAQNISLDSVLNQPDYRTASKEPFYSVIEQFIKAHKSEPDYDRHVKMGEELLRTDFSSTLYLPTLDVLRLELSKSGSRIKVGDKLQKEKCYSADYMYIPKPMKTFRKLNVEDKAFSYEQDHLSKAPESFKWFVNLCCFFCGTHRLSHIIEECENVIIKKYRYCK